MRTVSSVLFLLGCLLLTAHCALVRKFSDTPPAAVSHGPWTVDGVAPGAHEEDCARALGECVESQISRNGDRTARWRGLGETLVTFGRDGALREVRGGTLLDATGTAVLRVGASLEAARAVLPQAKLERHTRPKGGGVISLSRTLVGSTLTWCDDRSALSIGFDAHGRSTYVRAEALR